MNWGTLQLAAVILLFLTLASITAGLFTPKHNSVHDANGNVAVPQFWEQSRKVDW